MATFSSDNPICGKWKLDHSENFEEYLKAAGVGAIKRQLAKRTSHIEQTIKCLDGNKVAIKIWSRVLTKEDTYVIDEAIDEETLEGEKVKGTMTFDGTKLTNTMAGTKKSPAYTIRYIEGDNLVHEFHYSGTTCKRFYNRME
ncbi:expressed hypothetical protein [Trichoplax adhaerens]|uniref:Cytosolic fatty-acid binding proteins domain-containing protein n=1 Tax=Trichoplax adhaerens TaxID=10228 RepID=B3S4H2_TRIAD|nr:expressed hypothetical protein [Trichoplax adhaerens]EDV22465.1 expressed hypothetical protein [Trichoplax adhaerens]|eukprot:XP_002115009.1 expressed hypothetical protein [Trichoplax adhaerens]